MKWLERRWSMILRLLLPYRLLPLDWLPSNFTGPSMRVKYWRGELLPHLSPHPWSLSWNPRLLSHLRTVSCPRIYLSVGIIYTSSLLTQVGKNDKSQDSTHPTRFLISCAEHTTSFTWLPTMQSVKETQVRLSPSRPKEDVSEYAVTSDSSLSKTVFSSPSVSLRRCQCCFIRLLSVASAVNSRVTSLRLV